MELAVFDHTLVTYASIGPLDLEVASHLLIDEGALVSD